MQKIDYCLLAEAYLFYKKQGYEYIEVPWVVPEEISNITKPDNRNNFYINDDVLVASAEQSLIKLSLDGILLPGKYFAISPCFRDDIPDKTHSTYFMKLELFITDNVNNESLAEMMHTAEHLFQMFMETNKVLTEDGFDIVNCNGMELGSYGIRKYEDLEWVYGTGLALPRFSIALEDSKNL